MPPLKGFKPKGDTPTVSEDFQSSVEDRLEWEGPKARIQLSTRAGVKAGVGERHQERHGRTGPVSMSPAQQKYLQSTEAAQKKNHW